jgi:hypothetical protein
MRRRQPLTVPEKNIQVCVCEFLCMCDEEQNSRGSGDKGNEGKACGVAGQIGMAAAAK